MGRASHSSLSKQALLIGFQNLSSEGIIQHATVFIGAGSETSAGIVTATTSYHVEYPDVMVKLQQEVRSAFRGDADIRHDEVD